MLKIIFSYTKKTGLKNIPFYILCLLSFFPILSVDITSKIILVFIVSSILVNRKLGLHSLKVRSKKHFVINSLFFFVLAFSLLYSFDFKEGLKILLRQISFLLFPLTIFYFLDLNKKQLILLGKLFVIANVFVVIYMIYHISRTDSIINIVNTNFNFRSIIDNNYSYKEWHPSYMSLFIVFSQLLIIKNLTTIKSKLEVFINIISFFLLLFFLIMLNSRSAIYAFLIVSPLLCFFQLKSTKKKITFILLLIPISILFYFFLISKFTLYNRLLFPLEKVYSWFKNGEVLKNGLNSRYYINICSLELFKGNPIFGYGIGDVKFNLRNCYLDKEFNNVFKQGLNSHNSFFYLLLSGGLIALISFLILIINNFLVSLKKKNFLFASFILLILFVFISENYLVRLNGIIFFASVNAFFYYDMNLKSIKNDHKE